MLLVKNYFLMMNLKYNLEFNSKFIFSDGVKIYFNYEKLFFDGDNKI